MDAYFYCSYKFSPVGFQITGVNQDGEFAAEGEDAKQIIHFLSNGGADSLLGKLQSGKYLFFIKGIDKTVEEIGDNAPGKDWYINFALTADEEELAKLCACAYYAYSDFNAFGDGLLTALEIAENANGFTVSADKLSVLFDIANKKYSSFCENGSVDFVSAPRQLTAQELGEIFSLLRNRDIRDEFSFVLLSATKNYFYRMYKLDPSKSIRISLPAEKNKQDFVLINDSENASKNKLVSGLVAGACLLIGGAITIKAIKAILK